MSAPGRPKGEYRSAQHEGTPAITLVKAEGVRVRLGRRDVLQDMSLQIGPGWTALVGPNGAGKSTLLRALAGRPPW